jgi:hypothetical protein
MHAKGVPQNSRERAESHSGIPPVARSPSRRFSAVVAVEEMVRGYGDHGKASSFMATYSGNSSRKSASP